MLLQLQNDSQFLTISEACEFLGLTKDELRSKCEQYGVEVFKSGDQWGFPQDCFCAFIHTLYLEQCCNNLVNSGIFIEDKATQADQDNAHEREHTMLNYIKSTRDLKGIYTFNETCTLLGVTAEELEHLCSENDIPIYQNSEEERIFTCYGYLTLNNRLYRKQCEASEQK